jgi:hypothetical protein
MNRSDPYKPANRLRFGVTVLSLVALAACADGTGVRSVQGPYNAGQDPQELLSYLSRGPDVRVAVLGNPTGSDDAAFGDAVTTAMNEQRDFGPQVNFTTRPVSEAGPNYRVVMAFAAPAWLGSNAACGLGMDADTTVPYQVTHGSGALFAALCFKERPISYATVQVAGIGGAEDPRLRAAAMTATRQLFPLNDPEKRDNKDQQEFFFP